MAATTDSLIRKSPGVMGGEACVRATRISVWILVRARQLGVSDAELLLDYPGLTLDDLAAAWAYYAANTSEIDDAIRRNEDDGPA